MFFWELKSGQKSVRPTVVRYVPGQVQVLKQDTAIHEISSPSQCLQHSLTDCDPQTICVLLSLADKQLCCELALACKYSLYWKEAHK